MTKLTRRQLLAGTAGTLLLQSCSKQQAASVVTNANVAKPLVAVVKAAGYTQDLYDTVRRILVDQGLNVKGKRVVLKPNLVEFDRNTAINTHPVLVHATLEAFPSLLLEVTSEIGALNGNFSVNPTTVNTTPNTGTPTSTPTG